MAKEKVLLKSSEFTRVDAVALSIRKFGRTDEKKVTEAADKLFTDKTGKPSNISESRANVKYAFRFLRSYEPLPETKKPEAKTKAKPAPVAAPSPEGEASK